MAQRDPPATARLFFGLPVGSPLAGTLGLLAVDVAAQADGRAVPAGNLHATLAFLGAVPRTRLGDLRTVGDEVDGARCHVQLDRVGSFGGARVAWIGATELPKPLVSLQQRLAQRLAEDGWALDARPFHLHVTLARRCRVALRTAAVPALAWRVDRVALFESIGTVDGPRYEPLIAWPLT